MQQRRALVTGAGGFIGHHLVARLKEEGFWVRGVDIKYPEFEETYADEFTILDLREMTNCIRAVVSMHDIYQLAADMGGIGYITSKLASIARNNALINLNMLEATRMMQGSIPRRYFYTSSACIYPQHMQLANAIIGGLKEEYAYPADPEPGYGWEKLFSEQLSQYYANDYRLQVRIARFHNIYGPMGTYEGGKEKSPAAICRKVAKAENGGEIEVWGDGQQTRSYCYIDDCITGIRKLMESSYTPPLNIGTEELVTVDQLVHYVSAAAGKGLRIKHTASKPQGVRGRNSDNTNMRAALHWEPQIKLEVGIKKTYEWILSQIQRKQERM